MRCFQVPESGRLEEAIDLNALNAGGSREQGDREKESHSSLLGGVPGAVPGEGETGFVGVAGHIKRQTGAGAGLEAEG